jgi:hypothetical protein
MANDPHVLYTNPHEQRRTSTKCAIKDSVNLQVFLNTREQLRRYGSDFARRRSGVRIPSAPLLKYVVLQQKYAHKRIRYACVKSLCSNAEGSLRR